MSFMKLKLGAAAAVAASARRRCPPLAQDSIYVPLLTYRTGPFAGSGIPIADGMHDYLRMLNERDGGIGGVKIAIEECETGYDTKKGVECYESIKGKNPVDREPRTRPASRCSSSRRPRSTRSRSCPWPTASRPRPTATPSPGSSTRRVTYWDGASVFIKYVAEKEGGLDKLKGKKIGLIHLDAPFGKEPIPLLEALAKEYGFELKLYPVAAQEMQNQGSHLAQRSAATGRTGSISRAGAP